MLGLGCCTWAFLAVVCGRLAAVASLAGEHGGFHSCNTWASRLGYPALEHRLTACGIFPDRELNLCLLHWQADCYPLNCQGSTRLTISHAQVSGAGAVLCRHLKVVPHLKYP